MSEWNWIEQFHQMTSLHRKEMAVGIGDDAGVWMPNPNRPMVFSCDCFVEGKHFPQLSTLSLEEIEWVGHRVVHANLSDLAAMGAQFCFANVSLGIPPSLAWETLRPIYKRLVAEIEKAGGSIMGGNITSTTRDFFIDLHVVGETQQPFPLQRKAEVDDWIGVTGNVGASWSGLQVFQENQHDKEFSGLFQAYFLPNARLPEGTWLAPFVHSMTDTSDGFLFNLSRLLPPALGAEIFAERIPQHPEQQAFLQKYSKSLQEWIASSSDDYELVFACSQENKEIIQTQWPFDTKLSWVGVVQNTRELSLVSEKQREKLQVKGWNHLK